MENLILSCAAAVCFDLLGAFIPTRAILDDPHAAVRYTYIGAPVLNEDGTAVERDEDGDLIFKSEGLIDYNSRAIEIGDTVWSYQSPVAEIIARELATDDWRERAQALLDQKAREAELASLYSGLNDRVLQVRVLALANGQNPDVAQAALEAGVAEEVRSLLEQME